ncbi:hypothetical protein LXL04_020966 [Taraxacum kok-saghyz]
MLPALRLFRRRNRRLLLWQVLLMSLLLNDVPGTLMENFFIPNWRITPNTIFTVPTSAYEWSRHSFPPGTLASIETLIHEHMGNSLRYASVKFSSYLAVAADHLTNVGPKLVDLEILRVQYDGLKERLSLLESVRHTFEVKMDLLVAEKLSANDRITMLEAKLGAATKHCEDLEVENNGMSLKMSENEGALGEISSRLFAEEGKSKWLVTEGKSDLQS